MRGIRLGIVGVVAALGWAAAPAAAAPTLTGTTVAGTAAATCTAVVGGHQVSYTAAGQATGPYPGAASDQGTFRLIDGVASGQTQFSIRSGTTTINGTRQVFHAEELSCGPSGVSLPFSIGPYEASWSITRPTSPLTAYRGTYTDSGAATVRIDGTSYGLTLQSFQDQATLVRCDLVVLGLVTLRVDGSKCP